MSAPQPVRLLRSGLTGATYVVTRYADHGDGKITAHIKHDVTDDANALVAQALQEAAAALPSLTEGEDREGTQSWANQGERDAYSLAIEEAQRALTTRAARIEAGGHR